METGLLPLNIILLPRLSISKISLPFALGIISTSNEDVLLGRIRWISDLAAFLSEMTFVGWATAVVDSMMAQTKTIIFLKKDIFIIIKSIFKLATYILIINLESRELH